MADIATHSIVMLIPASLRGDGNHVAWGLEMQIEEGLTFSRALTSNGSTITHYGTRFWASNEFIGTLDQFKRLARLPDIDFPAHKLTEPRARDALTGFIYDLRPRAEIPDGGFSHWADVLAANGLQEFEDGR